MQSDELQHLINDLRESDHVEVKSWLGGLSDKTEKAKLAKEVIALANSGGGHIVIGFEDDKGNGHRPIKPNENESNAFSQDAISDVVHRYCTPAIQCSVQYFRQDSGAFPHPIITVPTSDSTPIFASKGSPGNQLLVPGTVYVRRVGGQSAPCQTQDDWEKLLSRLVFARQDRLVDAIRKVLNPNQGFEPQGQGSVFDDWIRESREQQSLLLHKLPPDHPHRLGLEKGRYEVAFQIETFNQPEISELLERLDRDRPRHSGWPPFVVLHREGVRPVPQGNVIQASLLSENSETVQLRTTDFWRLSNTGMGHLVREMQEDHWPKGADSSDSQGDRDFSYDFSIYRMTECLKLVEWLGSTFSTTEAAFRLRVTYFGTAGRQLRQSRPEWFMACTGEASQNEITSEISGLIGDISLNTEEMIYSLVKPVVSQFSFARLPKHFVDSIVREVLSFRV